MKSQFLLFTLVSILVLLSSCQPKVYQSSCADNYTSIPPLDNAPVLNLGNRVNDGRHIQKIDNLIFLDDDAQSMFDCIWSSEKRKISFNLITRIQKTIPTMSLNQGLRIFGPVADLVGLKSETLYGMSQPSSNDIKPVIITHTYKTTMLNPLALALDSVYQELKSVSGKTSVVVVSDFTRDDDQPILSASMINHYYKGQVCIYPVVIGYDVLAKQRADALVNAAGCGATGDALALMDPELLANYVENIVYDVVEMEKPVLEGPVPAIKPVSGEQEKAPVMADEPAISEMKAQSDMKVLTYQNLQTEKELRFYLNVHFDFDKAMIKEVDAGQLLILAEFMKGYPETKTVIEGHTCDIGVEKYNVSLSSKRAEAVKNYLVEKHHIDATRIDTKGYGSSRPIADNSTAKGRVKNRRAEALIITVITQ